MINSDFITVLVAVAAPAAAAAAVDAYFPTPKWFTIEKLQDFTSETKTESENLKFKHSSIMHLYRNQFYAVILFRVPSLSCLCVSRSLVLALQSLIIITVQIVHRNA